MSSLFTVLIDLICAGAISYSIGNAVDAGRFGLAGAMFTFCVLMTLYSVQHSAAKTADKQ